MIEFEVKSKKQHIIGEHKRQTQDTFLMQVMKLMA